MVCVVQMIAWMVLLPLESAFVEDSCSWASCHQNCAGSYPADFGKCFCDDMCLAYGDCCMDYLAECTDHNFTDTDKAMEYMYSQSKAPFMECIVTIEAEIELRKIFGMITKCPDGLADPMCEDREGGSNDPSRVIPVYDESTNLVYFNQHCARCHGVQEFTAPNPQFVCANTSEAAAVREQYGMTAFAEYLVRNCEMMLDWRALPIRRLRDEFSCKWRLETLIQDCANTSDANQTLYCQSFKAVVGVPYEWGTYYKNQFCAMCNGLPADDLECEYSEPDFPTIGSGGDGLPSFGLLMDFSSDNGFSDQVTFSKHLVCPNTQYLDVLNNECVSRSCSSTEVLFDGQCTPLEMDFTNLVNIVPSSNEIYILVKTERQDVTIEDLIRTISDYEESLAVTVTSIGFADCVSGSVSTFQGQPTSASLDVCLEIAFSPTFDSFLWSEMISASVWDDIIFSVGLVKNLVLTTHAKIPPICRLGELKWHQNFTLVTSDLVGSEASYSLIIPDLDRTYPLDSTAFLMEVDFGSGKQQVQYGICELAVFTCDKVTVDNDDYNVTENNETYVQLVVQSADGQQWEIDASRSDFAITSRGLVICAEVLVNENITVSNSSISVNGGDAVQRYLTVTGLSLSILCLLITIIVHCLFPSLQRTMAGKLLINICVSLLFAQLLFVVSGQWSSDYVVCKVLAALQHYLWLVSFCWMNVFAIDVSMTFVNMKRGITSTGGQSKRIVTYACYAWGLPACFCFSAVCVDVLTDLPFTYGWETVASAACWISPGQALLYSFGVPIGLILLINAVCFALTLVVFIQTRKQAQKATSSESNADTVLISVKLSTVMGFTWIFGFLANVESLWFVVYLFILFNTLQGVFLFVSFLCTKRMYRLMKHFVQTGERVMSSTTQSTKSQQASTTSAVTRGSVTKSPVTNGPEINRKIDETKDVPVDVPANHI